jgi:hypothetical protein
MTKRKTARILMTRAEGKVELPTWIGPERMLIKQPEVPEEEAGERQWVALLDKEQRGG